MKKLLPPVRNLFGTGFALGLASGGNFLFN